jgi:hypothetical protein
MENANLLREGGPENSKRIALGAEGGTFIVGVPRWLRMTGTPGCFFAIAAPLRNWWALSCGGTIGRRAAREVACEALRSSG